MYKRQVLEALKSEIGDRARIAKIDVDQHEELAASYRIQMVPTFILFRKGEADVYKRQARYHRRFV